jgi:voltage-gated sodium channel
MNGHTSRFERVATGAILANTAVLAWGWLDPVHELGIERIDTCFVVFFLIELLVRLRRAGWRWLAQPWNLFDAAIIVLALLPVVGDSITVVRMARLARLVHFARHTSHLMVVAWLGRRKSARVPA